MASPSFHDAQRHAREIVRAVMDAADPAAAVRRAWPEELDAATGVTLLAFGKGSAAMASEAITRLGRSLTAGCVVTVPEHVERVRAACVGAGDPPVEIVPADHPLPTTRNIAAARRLAETAGRAGASDLVLVLISGGGSAQLTSPAGRLTLDDLRTATEALLRSGAPIRAINAVRKHCEVLKGGGLARLVHPARSIVLVLSDVLGDPLDVVSSGPMSPDPSTYEDALEVFDRFGLRRVSPAVTAHLVAGARGEHPETPKAGDPVFERVETRVIGNNELAARAAAGAAAELGFRVVDVRGGVEGEASEVGRALAEEARALPEGPACIVAGGETTVTVGGATGRGGRNQELALAAALALDGGTDAALLSLATDGVDGPTDAAGAFVTGETAEAVRRAGRDPDAALRGHDSHPVLDAAGALIRTGPSGTNVNDVMVALRY